MVKVIAILGIIMAIIYFFPPTHKLLVEFYENNKIMKTVLDIIGNILQGIWEGIKKFCSRIF